MGSYDSIYRRSITDPVGFWSEAAAAIDWFKPWDKVLDDSRAPFYRWFAGGELNTCCLLYTSRWRPRPARLDLAQDTVHPPPPETVEAFASPDPHAQAVGQELQALLVDAQVMTLAGIAVTDTRGTVVATTGPSLGRSLTGFDEVRRALNGEPLSLLRERLPDAAPPAIDSISRGTLLRVFVAAPILHDRRVVAAGLLWRPPASLSQVLHGKRYHLLAAAGLLLATVIAMSVLTSFAVVRPLRRLVRQARRATAGEKGAMTALARPITREIADLSQAVVTMAGHLEQRADYILSLIHI